MAIVLTTSRLRLRELELHDAPFILTQLNEPSFINNIGDRGVRSLQDAENYLANGPIKSYSENGHGLNLVELLDEGTPIGLCGLLKREELEAPDIGFALLPAYWKNGYALEAADAIIKYSRNRLQVNRILAITSMNNTDSINLLDKLGLHFERKIQMDPEKDAVRLFSSDKLPK